MIGDIAEKMNKVLCNSIAILFCLLTLGFVDVCIKYTDGTKFKWVGWISLIQKGMND